MAGSTSSAHAKLKVDFVPAIVPTDASAEQSAARRFDVLIAVGLQLVEVSVDSDKFERMRLC